MSRSQINSLVIRYFELKSALEKIKNGFFLDKDKNLALIDCLEIEMKSIRDTLLNCEDLK